jgi:drug/metabolite transporter (DMT)-like permease
MNGAPSHVIVGWRTSTSMNSQFVLPSRQIAAFVLVNQPGMSDIHFLIWAKTASSSSDVGTMIKSVSPASTRAPSRTYSVASPPSSRIETQALQVSALADWQVLGLLLYLGLAPTALGYLAYCSGMARCRSANVGLIATMVEPAIATVLAWLLLHEKLLPGVWAGCFMVSVAMLLLWWSEQRKRNTLSG